MPSFGRGTRWRVSSQTFTQTCPEVRYGPWMEKEKYASAETITMFMDAFHMMSSRSYWPRLIDLAAQLDELDRFEATIDNETGRVQIATVKVSNEDETLAAAHVRQFVVNNDAVRLDKVSAAVKEQGLRSKFIDDAIDQWNQQRANRLPFRTIAGEAVGVVLADKYITWDNPGPARASTSELTVSLFKFADTMFHEGLFHPFEPGAMGADTETYRKVVRTVPEIYRRRFVCATLASAVFAATMLHDQIERLSTTWARGDSCWEHRRMDLHWAKHEAEKESSL